MPFLSVIADVLTWVCCTMQHAVCVCALSVSRRVTVLDLPSCRHVCPGQSLQLVANLATVLFENSKSRQPTTVWAYGNRHSVLSEWRCGLFLTVWCETIALQYPNVELIVRYVWLSPPCRPWYGSWQFERRTLKNTKHCWVTAMRLKTETGCPPNTNSLLYDAT